MSHNSLSDVQLLENRFPEKIELVKMWPIQRDSTLIHLDVTSAYEFNKLSIIVLPLLIGELGEV